MFKKFFKTLTAVSAYNKTYNELQALTDFELRDIGISRGEIHDIARESQLIADAKKTVKSEYKLFEVHP
jgi:uncharacterized protein YjiS (DUF1127 family)